MATLTTKSSDWKYEKEWRCIMPEGGKGLQPLPAQMLTGLIFGCKTSDDHKRMILDWLAPRGQSVKLYEARIRCDRYGLDIVENN
jgi:hypothetical protein